MKDLILDPIRQRWVKATPEEQVRQRLLLCMMKELGYPRALIGVERELKSLPHLKHISAADIPARRVDIIVFARGIHPEYALFPLLMIECKAVGLTPKVVQQVVGYNGVVQAPFLAVANMTQVLSGSFDLEARIFRFTVGLPSFSTLMAQL